jgi:hypothetical protein
MLKQVQIFAENKAGRVQAIMETLKKAEINVRAMSIAESAEHGFVRLIASDAEKAVEILKQSGFKAKLVDVIGFTVPDKFGALCDVLSVLGKNGINIEYSYSLMGCKHGNANILIRVKDCEKASAILSQVGIKLFTQEDLTS